MGFFCRGLDCVFIGFGIIMGVRKVLLLSLSCFGKLFVLPRRTICSFEIQGSITFDTPSLVSHHVHFSVFS